MGAALHVRGSVRRRFLRECRDHLADAAAERGEEAAVRVFGPARETAAAIDAEVAVRRGLRSTFATIAAVLATGGSTLALVRASSPSAAAPVWWAIAFFVASQLAAVSAGLALVQAGVLEQAGRASGLRGRHLIPTGRRRGLLGVDARIPSTSRLSGARALSG